MRTRHRALLLATTIVVAELPTIAAAQDAGNEIIVTARRKEERLQDVPISISVLNQQEINDRNIVGAKDLAISTPSLGVNTRYGSENTSFSLRGFSQESFNAPSVAVYFADVVAPRGASSIASGEGAGPGSFFDLQNVQVLKGPQGTLFGRNTTGGAILLVPTKPTSEVGGYVEGSYGNYDMKRLQAVLNLPLGNSARLRLGVDRLKRDGFQRNISGVGPNRLGDSNYVAARASLVVDVTPTLENYTIVSYTHSNTNGSVAQVTECNKNFIGSATNFKVPLGYYACEQIRREQASGYKYAVANAVKDPHSKLWQFQIINTTTWEASDNLTIKNIASYARLKNDIAFDVFGFGLFLPTAAEYAAAVARGDAPAGGLPPPAQFAGQFLPSTQPISYPGKPSNHQWTATEEFQVQGVNIDGKLNWQAGAYIEVSRPATKFTGFGTAGYQFCTDVVSVQCLSPYGGYGQLSRELANRYFRDMALYAQASYDLTSTLRLTGGLRYTHDKSRSEDTGLNWRISDTGAIISNTCSNVTATFPGCLSKAKKISKAPTWLINLDYRPMEDVLIYAKYARGYRQGITNPRALVPYKAFGPEKVDSYELGAKTSWHGALPGHFNIAGFYNDLRDAQVQVSWRNGANTSTAVVNGGKARIYGVEVDGSISPFDGFRLSGSGTYLNARFQSVVLPTAPPPFTAADAQTSILTEIPLIFAPKWKATATANYVLPLSEDVGKIDVGATYAYTSGYYTLANIGGNVPGYGLLNLNVNWKSVAGSPVDVSLFATNVTKKLYSTFKSIYLPTLGFSSEVFGEPRMYGIRVRYNFGE
jgi:iron complex outermembrane receptor protein